MATIGLRDVYVAELLTDPISGTATYDTPKKIAGAISANVNPNSSSATLFYDDGPGDTAATMGEITVEVNLADIPLEIQAFLFGHLYSQGILRRRGTDTPPWVALGYRTLKSTGGYLYHWLLKGKFQVPEQNYETKGDAITFNTPTVTGSFVKRDSDDEWQLQADSDADDFDPSYMDTWFNSPNVVAGTSASGTFGGVTILVTGEDDMDGTQISFVVDTPAGAAWADGDLTVTLVNAQTYTAAQLQTLINAATGTPAGDVIVRTSGTVTAATGLTLVLTLS